MSARLRVAVIGGGLIAQGAHLPNLRRLDGLFDVVALVEPRLEIAQTVARRYGIGRVHASVDELLDTGGIDAALICTPATTHADVAVACLDAGLHVFCEKPLCVTLDEADRIMEARERSGRVVQVGYMKRFDPAVEALYDDLPDSTAGLRYVSVVAHDPEDGPYFGEGSIVRGPGSVGHPPAAYTPSASYAAGRDPHPPGIDVPAAEVAPAAAAVRPGGVGSPAKACYAEGVQRRRRTAPHPPDSPRPSAAEAAPAPHPPDSPRSSAAEPVATRAFLDGYLGSLVHFVNLVHGALERMGEPLPAPIVASRWWAGGEALTASAVLSGGAGWDSAWIQLRRAADHREQVAFYFEDSIRTLEFPSPWLHGGATVYERSGADAGGARVASSLRSHREAFVRELEHFHACVAEGEACRTPPEQARTDIEALTAMFAAATTTVYERGTAS